MKDLITLKWIFQKTKSQNMKFVVLNVLNILYSALSIYLIMISKNVIDSATSGMIVELRKNIILLIVISLLEIVLKAVIASIEAVVRARLEVYFKQDILHTILKRNYEKIQKFHSGELMTRIVSDVNIIIDTLVSLIPNIISMLSRLICAMWLLFQISREFVIILLLRRISAICGY